MIIVKFAPELKPVLKHADHDQQSHGSWATGGLKIQAKQFNTFKEFSDAISQNGLRPKAWHIADEEFKLNPNYKPTNRLGGTSSESGLFVGDPETWQDYASGRETVIEYDMTGLKWTKNPLSDTKADFYTDQSGNQGFFVRPQGFEKLKEVGRFTLAEAISRAQKQQKEMPSSKEEAKKIWDSLNNLKKHAEHDQSSHGNWAGNNVSFTSQKDYFGSLLTMRDDKGKTLASVNYVDAGPRLELNMINSYDEGKGYATKILENLYSTFPEHSIFWGKTMNPASTHLAEKFATKYGRTTYIPWGEGVIDGYEWGELYGQKEPIEKHAEHDQSSHGNWAKGSTLDEMPYEWKPKLNKSNMTDEEYSKNSKILKNIAEAPVSTYLFAMELDLVVKEGRFKSLSEIPINSENFLVLASEEYRQNRSDLENGLWGVPESGVQPIYGFMDTSFGGHEPATTFYGNVKVTLKDNVAGRTTFSVGDSLNSTLIPVKVSDARAGALSKTEIQASFTSQKTTSYIVQSELRSPDRISYFEAQVHGGVSLKDIKAVTMSEYARVSPSTLDSLKALGVEVTRINDNR